MPPLLFFVPSRRSLRTGVAHGHQHRRLLHHQLKAGPFPWPNVGWRIVARAQNHRTGGVSATALVSGTLSAPGSSSPVPKAAPRGVPVTAADDRMGGAFASRQSVRPSADLGQARRPPLLDVVRVGQLGDPGNQVLAVHRLGDETDSAGIQRPLGVLLLHPTGNDQHRCLEHLVPGQ